MKNSPNLPRQHNNIKIKMALDGISVVTFLVMVFPANGCGPALQQQARTLNYEVTGFKLPPEMVYSEDKGDPSLVPRLSTSEQQVVSFVQNTIKQSIEDVLYQQGRAAGLSYDIISLILNQLDVTVRYTPLKCVKVFTNDMGMGVVKPMMLNCQIIGDTVMKTCIPDMPRGGGVAAMPMCMMAMLKDIEPKHLTISGTITTTNVIMANWSTQMWQIVLNRALQSVTSGPIRSQFIGATVTLR